MRLEGQHQGHSKGSEPTLTLPAMCDHRHHFWHLNFGDAGSLNDVCTLEKSDIVGSRLSGALCSQMEPHDINGNSRDWMCFLADGMCPEWAIFVKTHSTPKQKKFARKQEGVRKDTECAFGPLVSHFHALKRPLWGWCVEDLCESIQCCGTLNNVITVERCSDLGVDQEKAQNVTNGDSPFTSFV